MNEKNEIFLKEFKKESLEKFPMLFLNELLEEHLIDFMIEIHEESSEIHPKELVEKYLEKKTPVEHFFKKAMDLFMEELQYDFFGDSSGKNPWKNL